jgi:hypothetical protein
MPIAATTRMAMTARASMPEVTLEQCPKDEDRHDQHDDGNDGTDQQAERGFLGAQRVAHAELLPHYRM